jgi:colanic acid/amylovoran biosynthesis glycosyltransferase
MSTKGFIKRNWKYIALFLFPAAFLSVVCAGIVRKIAGPFRRVQGDGRDGGERRKKKIAYVTGRFPCFAMTFLRNEVVYLRGEGLNVQIVSVRLPNESVVQEADKKLLPYVTCLEPFSWGRMLAVSLFFLMISPLRFFRYVRFFASNREKWSWEFLSAFKASFRLAWIVRRRRIDHLHAYFAYELIYCLAAHMLTGVAFSTGAVASDIYRNYKSRCFREAAAAIRFIRASSIYNKRALLGMIDAEYYRKVKTIYIPIDTDRFVPKRPSKGRGKPIILTVCRFDPKKGLDFLIMAMNVLKSRERDFLCIIIGDGEQKEYLEGLIEKYGLHDSVKMIGLVDQARLVDYYGRASVFVLPCITLDDKTSDGIPVALMEAQCMGIPVVSTDVSGIPELIRDGYSGRLVPQKDCFGLANAIDDLIGDAGAAREMGGRGREVVIEGFDNKSEMRKIRDLLQG